MKTLLLIISLVITMLSCTTEKENKLENQLIAVTYPATYQDSSKDEYHGVTIEDPYRWLENDRSVETEEWVKAQNAVTFDYLSKIPYRKNIEDRYRELYNYARYSNPIKVGDYYFFYKNDGLQNQAVIYKQKGIDGTPDVFMDPNTLSDKGTVSINLSNHSPDEKHLAYLKQEAGSDWAEIRVIQVAGNTELPDVIKHVKFSGVAWDKYGFYYSRYPDPEEGSKFSAANQFHSVYYHRLGTSQNEDELIYRDEKNPTHNHNVDITEDQNYIVLTKSSGTDGFETYFKKNGDKSPFKPLYTGFKNKNYIIDHVNGQFYMLTDVDAPNYRLVQVDPDRTENSNWRDIIPEQKNLLAGVSLCGGKLVAEYLVDVTSRVKIMNLDGSGEVELKLPGLGTFSGMVGKKDDPTAFYSFSSILYPSTVFKYDFQTNQSNPYFKSTLLFNPADFEEKQIFYTSKDGTKVPMFVVCKKGLKLDGQNPTYLYGYGGFNISVTPGFNPWTIMLLENSGVYALANIRGGGEYGEAWHQAGMLDKKQNVFDDFIAAAEYLINEKYTSKDKLSIAGGSNGGLLVGACMTQRPDLFAVAFPAVGVLDMLKYHQFTIGHAWAVEYGSSDDPAHFKNLLGYSPYHNLKPGVKYPATLVTTADHDDRVVPAHSFKFAARLQQHHSGKNPVLIRIETEAGHGAGKPVSKIIEEGADRLAFLFYNTNSPVIYLKG